MCEKATPTLSVTNPSTLRTFGIVLLIVLYYAASTLNSCLTKQILLEYPRPLTVTIVQQTLSSIGGVWRHCRGGGSASALLQHSRAVLPISLALVVSLASYRVSLLYNAVSFAQVVKGLNPLFALMCSAALLRERSTPARTFSLLLLVGGVGIATATELNFTTAGFLLALLSSFTQSVQAVLSKALLVRGLLLRDELFASSAVLALLLLIPIWLAVDSAHVLRGELPSGTVVALLALNGCCNFITQLLSFAMLCLLTSPVSAAVVSTVKRVVVVAAAALWFGTRVTPLHACGIGTAIVGVGLYQAASSRAGKGTKSFSKLEGVKVEDASREPLTTATSPPFARRTWSTGSTLALSDASREPLTTATSPPFARRTWSTGSTLALSEDAWGLTRV